MATASSLRCVGAARRSVWLHNRFWSSAAGRIDAARMANAVELSAGAAGIEVYHIVPHPAGADNGDGLNTAGID